MADYKQKLKRSKDCTQHQQQWHYENYIFQCKLPTFKCTFKLWI